MTFRTYSAAENYLKRSGKRGGIHVQRYNGNGYDFCEYTVWFY